MARSTKKLAKLEASPKDTKENLKKEVVVEAKAKEPSFADVVLKKKGEKSIEGTRKREALRPAAVEAPVHTAAIATNDLKTTEHKETPDATAAAAALVPSTALPPPPTSVIAYCHTVVARSTENGTRLEGSKHTGGKIFFERIDGVHRQPAELEAFIIAQYGPELGAKINGGLPLREQRSPPTSPADVTEDMVKLRFNENMARRQAAPAVPVPQPFGHNLYNRPPPMFMPPFPFPPPSNYIYTLPTPFGQPPHLFLPPQYRPGHGQRL